MMSYITYKFIVVECLYTTHLMVFFLVDSYNKVTFFIKTLAETHGVILFIKSTPLALFELLKKTHINEYQPKQVVFSL